MTTPNSLNAYETELFDLYTDATTQRLIKCGSKANAQAMRLRLYGFKRALEKKVNQSDLEVARQMGWLTTLQNALLYEHLVQQRGGDWYVVLSPRPKLKFEVVQLPEEAVADSVLEMHRLQNLPRAEIHEEMQKTTEQKAEEATAAALAAIGYTPGQVKQPENSESESKGSIEATPSNTNIVMCSNCKRGFVQGFGVMRDGVEYCNTNCAVQTKSGEETLDGF